MSTSSSVEPVNLLHGRGDFGDVIKVANFKAGALACIIKVNQIIQDLKDRAISLTGVR